MWDISTAVKNSDNTDVIFQYSVEHNMSALWKASQASFDLISGFAYFWILHQLRKQRIEFL